jgi:general L-amino acid transport system permease protein
VSLEKLKLHLRPYFSNKRDGAISVVLIFTLSYLMLKLFLWLVVDSVILGDASSCREGSGACLAFLVNKGTYLLFGTYPREELWRAILSVVLMALLMLAAWWRLFWNKKIIALFFLVLIASYILLAGGIFGMPPVSSHLFGGLPITMLLALTSIGVGLPIGIALAIARRSHFVLYQKLAVLVIELVRGVPLISLLFLSSLMLPLFFPAEFDLPKLLRAQVVLILFVAAYMAEVIRGGLQSLPKGQEEAAWSLGLSRFQTYRLILIPQAMTKVIVPLFNTGIGMFKDTSLVIIIALFDLMFTLKSSLSDADWMGFTVEAYLFGGIIYYAFCKYLSLLGNKINGHFAGR